MPIMEDFAFMERFSILMGIDANYESNDDIDPGKYAANWLLAVGPWCVLGVCLNYELQIAGTVEFEFSYG